MNFADFTEQVRKIVSKEIGDGYKVKLNDVRKNNNVILKGLTIVQEDNNISPTIYLNSYFEEYVNGKKTLGNIVDDVMDTYSRNRIDHYLDMRYFLNYDDVRARIVYKLINTEKNRKLLEDVPHIDFLDLSIVFQVMVAQEEIGAASILIHNSQLNMWNVSVDILYQAAKENTKKLMPYEIKAMSDILHEIINLNSAKNYNEANDFRLNLP